MIRCRHHHHGISSIISSSSLLTTTTTTNTTSNSATRRRYTSGIINGPTLLMKYPSARQQHQHPHLQLPTTTTTGTIRKNSNTPRFTEEDDPFDLSLYYPTNSSSSSSSSDNSLEEVERLAAEEAKRQAIRDEIDSRTGRLWTDPMEITDEDWASGKTLKDLPVWTRDSVSRVSVERVRLHPDGIPTLTKLATIPLPTPQPPHPAKGNPTPYNRHRSLLHRQKTRNAVSTFATPSRIEEILSLPTPDEKQDAVDDLFEECQEAMRNVTVDGGKDGGVEEFVGGVLAYQPDFPVWVEKELEGVLRDASRLERERAEGVVADNDEDDDEKKDQEAVPVFMDFHDIPSSDDDAFDDVVPKLLHPMKKHPKDGPGRMLEEWELAADDNAKRIMARRCMRDIARLLASSSTTDDGAEACRVYIRGEQGTGKTAAVAAIVASARLSGHIVLFLPDGDRLRKNGYYVEPDEQREGVYNLPRLAKEVCEELLECHGKEMEGMVLDGVGRLEELMTPMDLRKLLGSIHGGSGDGGKGKGKKGKQKKADKDTDAPTPPLALNDLLKLGSEDEELSSGIYGAVLHALMNQSEFPFTIVCDQFNCYIDHGEYFHMNYDPNVVKAIPPNRISLFEPFLSAIGLEKDDDGNIRAMERPPVLMKRGGIIVANTGSHAVVDSATKALNDAVDGCGGITAVDVPRFSPIEVEHVLANFEATGIGRLRLDQGATVMDDQEVAYLRMVSGGVGQKLLDACIF